MTQFSKKTGDFASLSATDIKVIAVAYMLEAQYVGEEHLPKEPTMKRTVELYKPGEKNGTQTAAKNLVGFYNPENDEDAEEHEWSDVENEETEEVLEEDEREGESGEDPDSEDDDEGWITPGNLKSKTLELLGADAEDEEVESVEVACLTNDFAMQNVLKQMGLHVLSSAGLLIKETKTWILRCYGCFGTTPKMELKFCPKCGHDTLKRVSVTLNKDGTQQIHISSRRILTGRGKKFSLPTFKGGKYAVNPIRSADQPMPQQRKTKMARQRTDVMNPDYTFGNAPFAKRDVTSRSAMLGVGNGQTGHYWSRKNPNEPVHKSGTRRKKRHV